MKYCLEPIGNRYDLWSVDTRTPSASPKRLTTHGNVYALLLGPDGPCWSQFQTEIWCQIGDGAPHRVLRERLDGPIERGDGFIAWYTGDSELAVISTDRADSARVVLMPAKFGSPMLAGFAVEGDRVVWAVAPETDAAVSTELHVARVTPIG